MRLLFVIQPGQAFVKRARIVTAAETIERDGFVVIMLRPGFFRLGRGIKRVLGRAAEPLLGFITPARGLKFESGRDILARLRLQRRSADAELPQGFPRNALNEQRVYK